MAGADGGQSASHQILVAHSCTCSSPTMGQPRTWSVLMIMALRPALWRNLPLSRHPRDMPPVPAGTRRVAQAGFPRGTIDRRLREALGTIYHGAGSWRDVFATVAVMAQLVSLVGESYGLIPAWPTPRAQQ